MNEILIPALGKPEDMILLYRQGNFGLWEDMWLAWGHTMSPHWTFRSKNVPPLPWISHFPPYILLSVPKREWQRCPRVCLRLPLCERMMVTELREAGQGERLFYQQRGGLSPVLPAATQACLPARCPVSSSVLEGRLTSVVFKIASKQGNPFLNLSLESTDENKTVGTNLPTWPSPAEVWRPCSVENSWIIWSLEVFLLWWPRARRCGLRDSKILSDRECVVVLQGWSPGWEAGWQMISVADRSAPSWEVRELGANLFVQGVSLGKVLNLCKSIRW